METRRNPGRPPSSSSIQETPAWEALHLIAPCLDAKTLAMSSCVSKQWRAAMSADHLWRSILLRRHPSSLHLAKNTPHRVIYARLQTASKRRMHHSIVKPRIELRQLVFAIDVFCNEQPVLLTAKWAYELGSGGDGVFAFNVDVGVEDQVAVGDVVEEWRVWWSVVMEGWRGVFVMMDRVGRGRVVRGSGVWFSEELPGPACCSASVSVGLVSELGIEFGGGGGGGEQDGRKLIIRRVRVGLLSVMACRYLSVNDALLYLQSFLSPAT